jgi:DNA-binding winged helix-turn-helix (wHTH) protein/TolB-like protein/tetratricopeptide (TPR) repeat protein
LEEFQLGSRTLQPHRQLLAHGERVALGKRALDILSVLAGARGEIVTKDELLEAVWPGVTVEENALQVHIVSLRKALGPDWGRIETIRGVGYRLAVDADGPRAAEAEGAAATLAGPLKTRAKRPRLLLSALATTVLMLAGVLYFALGRDGGSVFSSDRSRIPVLIRALAAGTDANPGDAALARGITDELIVRLRGVPELQIVTAEADGTVANRRFSGAHVFDGNIQTSGSQIRVFARLSDSDGEVLWSQTFERKLVEVFDVQQAIASSVAKALSVSLDVGASTARNGGTDNPEAFAAYMQYWQHLISLDTSVPMTFLKRAVELDPDYVRAQASLANLDSVVLSIAPMLDDAAVARLLDEMDRASSRAVRQAPELVTGHGARAWYLLAKKDLPGAVREMEQVAALDRGNDPEFRTYQATFAQFLGRAQEALAIRRSSQLIDPAERNDPYLIVDLLMVGNYQAAVAQYDRLTADPANNLQPFVYHAAFAKIMLGQEREAIALLEQKVPAIAANYRKSAADTSLTGKTLPELRQWADHTFGAGGHIPIAARAAEHARFGRDELAMRLLQVAMERPGGNGMFYLWYPSLAKVRERPEFQKLVTDLGLVKIWRESGNWGDFCRPVSPSKIACT